LLDFSKYTSQATGIKLTSDQKALQDANYIDINQCLAAKPHTDKKSTSTKKAATSTKKAATPAKKEVEVPVNVTVAPKKNRILMARWLQAVKLAKKSKAHTKAKGKVTAKPKAKVHARVSAKPKAKVHARVSAKPKTKVSVRIPKVGGHKKTHTKAKSRVHIKVGSKKHAAKGELNFHAKVKKPSVRVHVRKPVVKAHTGLKIKVHGKARVHVKKVAKKVKKAANKWGNKVSITSQGMNLKFNMSTPGTEGLTAYKNWNYFLKMPYVADSTKFNVGVSNTCIGQKGFNDFVMGFIKGNSSKIRSSQFFTPLMAGFRSSIAANGNKLMQAKYYAYRGNKHYIKDSVTGSYKGNMKFGGKIKAKKASLKFKIKGGAKKVKFNRKSGSKLNIKRPAAHGKLNAKVGLKLRHHHGAKKSGTVKYSPQSLGKKAKISV
jgi:hypothetical protein